MLSRGNHCFLRRKCRSRRRNNPHISTLSYVFFDKELPGLKRLMEMTHLRSSRNQVYLSVTVGKKVIVSFSPPPPVCCLYAFGNWKFRGRWQKLTTRLFVKPELCSLSFLLPITKCLYSLFKGSHKCHELTCAHLKIGELGTGKTSALKVIFTLSLNNWASLKNIKRYNSNPCKRWGNDFALNC